MIPRYRSPLSLPDVLRSLAPTQKSPLGSSAPGLAAASAITWMPSASQGLFQLLEGWGQAGRVVLPAYTCLRVVTAVRAAGWTPVFVDVDPGTLAMDTGAVARELALGGKPQVVLATHLHGIPVDLAEIRALAGGAGARLVEDCAMAQGAQGSDGPVGSTGDAAIFSFGLGKCLSFGTGGALVGPALQPAPQGPELTRLALTSALASRAGFLGDVRFHLQEGLKSMLRIAGANRSEALFNPERISAPAARQLARLAMLSRIEHELQALRERSFSWLEWAAGLDGDRVQVPRLAPGAVPCCPSLPLFVQEPPALAARLRRHGVDTARYFDYCAARLDGAAAAFAGAEWLASRVLLIPASHAADRKMSIIRDIISDYAERG